MDSITSLVSKAPTAGANLIEGSQPKAGTNTTGRSERSLENDYQTSTVNEDRSLTVEEVDYAVEVINNTMSLFNRSLNFQVDTESGRTVISIIDNDTNETVKQIPSEDLLKLITHMEEMQSILAGEQV